MSLSQPVWSRSRPAGGAADRAWSTIMFLKCNPGGNMWPEQRPCLDADNDAYAAGVNTVNGIVEVHIPRLRTFKFKYELHICTEKTMQSLLKTSIKM